MVVDDQELLQTENVQIEPRRELVVELLGLNQRVEIKLDEHK